MRNTYPAPIFIVTGDGDVGCAVEAVKSGAFDYLAQAIRCPRDHHSRGNAIGIYAKRSAAAMARRRTIFPARHC